MLAKVGVTATVHLCMYTQLQLLISRCIKYRMLVMYDMLCISYVCFLTFIVGIEIQYLLC